MNKPICDITGTTPASTFQIIVDGKIRLNLDLASAEIDRIVKEIQSQVKVVDVQGILGKVVADVVVK